MGLVNGDQSFWRSAIVELSLFLTQASCLRGRIWFLESRGQLCAWSKEHLVESCVFSVMIGVLVGPMSASVRMHRQRCFAFAVREGCRELASEVGRVSERTRFKRSSRSIRSRSRAFRSIVPEAGLECPSSDEDVMSLRERERERESRADFPELLVHFLDPSEWGNFDGVRWSLLRGKHHSRNTFDLVCCSIC